MKYYLIYFIAFIKLRMQSDMNIGQCKYVAEQIAYFKTKM